MRTTLPVKKLDKTPRFRFAVLSIRLGSDTAELESSFDSQGQAQNMFDRQYSHWGIDADFYLVDWNAQTILAEHIAEPCR